MSLRAFLLSGMCLCLFGGQMHAAVILQDFESGSIAPGTAGAGYSNLGPCVAGGANELSPEGSFAVTTNAQNCHSSWFATVAHDGSQFLAVNGLTSTGPVYQQTQTGLITGATYTLSAWFAGLFTANPANITWNITSGGTSPVNSFTTSTNGAWQLNGITFVATGSTLTFNIAINTTQVSGNDFGVDTITLDTTAQSAVPEPGSSCLIGLGLTALWGLRRYRHRGTAIAAE